VKVILEMIQMSPDPNARHAQSGFASQVSMALRDAPGMFTPDAIDGLFNGALSMEDARMLAAVMCTFGPGLETVSFEIQDNSEYMESRWDAGSPYLRVPIRISCRLQITLEGMPLPLRRAAPVASPPAPQPIPREPSPSVKWRQRLRNSDI
jgi:hypothetical protein